MAKVPVGPEAGHCLIAVIPQERSECRDLLYRDRKSARSAGMTTQPVIPQERSECRDLRYCVGGRGWRKDRESRSRHFVRDDNSDWPHLAKKT